MSIVIKVIHSINVSVRDVQETSEAPTTMWGSNQNTNSGPCESGHKEYIKKCQANAMSKG